MANNSQPKRKSKANPILASRLAERMKERGIGTRRLAEDVQQRVGENARGATYPGIRALVAGNILRPRREILDAIADVLGVPAEWLLGRGERSAASAAVAEQRDASGPPAWDGPSPGEAIRDGIAYSFPEFSRLGRHYDAPLDALTLSLSEVYTDLVVARDQVPYREAIIPGLRLAAEAVGEVLAHPLRKLLPAGVTLTDSQIESYALAMAQALHAVLPPLRTLAPAELLHVVPLAPASQDVIRQALDRVKEKGAS